MNCAGAREAMLVAELDELEASGIPTPLTTHIADCTRCRTLADAILKQTAHVGLLVDQRPRRTMTARPLVILATLPIAAAVVVAVTLAVRRPEPVADIEHRSLPVANEVSVDVARGQQATVLKTPNPAVTVIWLTPGEGQ